MNKYRITRLVNGVQVREIVEAYSPLTAVYRQTNKEGSIMSVVNLRSREVWTVDNSTIDVADHKHNRAGV